MPEDPDDRGPQHTGEVPPQPNEPAWKKRKAGEMTPTRSEQERDRIVREENLRKPDADKRKT